MFGIKPAILLKIYNEKFLKTIIKSHCDGATDFYDKEMPKVCS